MRKDNTRITALAFVILILFHWPACARVQAAKAPYPVMAPLDQYLIPDKNAEIALARSSAPASISDAAEVMAYGPETQMRLLDCLVTFVTST
jgi:hypothetical protein